MKSRSRSLLDKSLAALLAAIEVYNKPDFHYREETFSILAINAWELLLKARVLQLSANRLSSILEYERRRLADGGLSAMRYRKRNRSGTHVSVGLFKALDLLVNEFGDRPNPAIRANLELLTEVRDNAVHFLNKGLDLEKRVQELGTACLKNYLSAVRQWFGADLSEYNFFLMPLAFFRNIPSPEAVMLNAEERKLLQYFDERVAASPSDPEADYGLAVRLDIRLSKATDAAATVVRVGRDPDAVAVRLEEEDVRARYPWTYRILTTRLRRRYVDFKENRAFHEIRRPLEEDGRYCTVRLLDPGNPKSGQKKFYNPNIVREFDRHYTRQHQPEGET